MSVIIKVYTGYVGATHECDTGLSIEEWNDLDNEARRSIHDDAIYSYIETSAGYEDEDYEFIMEGVKQ